MSMTPPTDARTRLGVLRRLLSEGEISTQEELVDELARQKFSVTQSTISRDLRRLGAIKAFDPAGRIVYRLPGDVMIPSAPTGGLKGLLLDIQHNGVMIVLHTTPGSASLVARHLDQIKLEGVMGTMAGDDTIFVAPSSVKKIEQTVRSIIEELS